MKYKCGVDVKSIRGNVYIFFFLSRYSISIDVRLLVFIWYYFYKYNV